MLLQEELWATKPSFHHEEDEGILIEPREEEDRKSELSHQDLTHSLTSLDVEGEHKETSSTGSMILTSEYDKEAFKKSGKR
jgi:hypothetical protein